jgi:hypothetical protein
MPGVEFHFAAIFLFAETFPAEPRRIHIAGSFSRHKSVLPVE